MAPPVTIDSTPQRALIIVPTVVLVFSTLAIGLRFYAHQIKRQRFVVDDALALGGLIFAYGLHINLCISVAFGGLGVSITTLEVSNIVVYAKTIIAGGALYGTAVTLLQVSILFLYVRLFSIVRWHVVACYVVMGFCVAWWIAFFGGTMGDCVPLQKLWTPTEHGTCIDQNKACGATGIAHIILDLIILILPLPIIWNMKIDMTRKFFVSVIFSIGIFATVCSILRISCIVSLVKIDSSDPTASTWMSYLFESLEVSMGVICVCSSSVPVVYSRVSPRLGSYARNLLSSLRGRSRFTTNHSQSSTGGELGYIGAGASNANTVPSKQGTTNDDIALADTTPRAAV
ncbi:hypothetical protein TMatcc_003359 [Talaromyces marneffei ATCC 18224]|uniref:Rhodopsin domain-containing protein n=2 Tax=Talaromyces marneffei TaxID=37727 RepID=B6Q4S4_TALMQ|nr:conserved hypothetical protein [Talaromyces marneffei ATCC 18224]KAE8556052.1 hypothetical protein EYB25_000751 [Talaromyces marneffei]